MVVCTLIFNKKCLYIKGHSGIYRSIFFVWNHQYHTSHRYTHILSMYWQLKYVRATTTNLSFMYFVRLFLFVWLVFFLQHVWFEFTGFCSFPLVLRCFVSIHALKCRSSNWYSLQLCFASLLSSCLLVFFLAVRTQSAARCGDFSNEGTRAHVPGYIYFSSGVMGFVRRLSPIEKQVAVCWVWSSPSFVRHGQHI